MKISEAWLREWVNPDISTEELAEQLTMAGLEVDEEPADYTSVLVLNIGATRGKKCPDDHWLYIPDSESRFHRVGFYSNVDASFMPASSRRGTGSRPWASRRCTCAGPTPRCTDRARRASERVRGLEGQ